MRRQIPDDQEAAVFQMMSRTIYRSPHRVGFDKPQVEGSKWASITEPSHQFHFNLIEARDRRVAPI